MRLLLIGPEYSDLSRVRNFSGVWSFYLSREFYRMGIQLVFDPQQHHITLSGKAIVDYYRQLPLDGIDHVIALGTRYFSKVPKGCADVLRGRVSGLVTQLYDQPIKSHVDATFCVRQKSKKRSVQIDGRKNVLVGWAADANIIQSAQPKDELRILIDHPHYGTGAVVDWTDRVFMEVQAFVGTGGWKRAYKSVRVRQLTDGGAEDCRYQRRPYRRETVNFETIAREYSQTHLFLVTHPESIGLSVLETAMAGALPIVPRDFVPQDRLDTVRHVSWAGGRHIPWNVVLKNIDVAASRETAMVNDWQTVAQRIVRRLEEGRE